MDTNLPVLMTPEEVADLLKVSIRCVHEMRKGKLLPAISLTPGAKRGGVYRFPQKKLFESLGIKAK